MRTTWSRETTKAVDYTVVRCLFRCHRYKTNYIKEVADMLKDLLAQELITEKEYARAKKYYMKLTGADIVLAR